MSSTSAVVEAPLRVTLQKQLFTVFNSGVVLIPNSRVQRVCVYVASSCQ